MHPMAASFKEGMKGMALKTATDLKNAGADIAEVDCKTGKIKLVNSKDKRLISDDVNEDAKIENKSIETVDPMVRIGAKLLKSILVVLNEDESLNVSMILGGGMGTVRFKYLKSEY